MLKVGSKGYAVKVLQSALRIVPADGDVRPADQGQGGGLPEEQEAERDRHRHLAGLAGPQRGRRPARPGKYAAYDKVVLKVGSKGSAVKVLQSALRIVPADGEFGPLTKAKVVAYQKARKLSATGIVTSPVWRALSLDAARSRPPPPGRWHGPRRRVALPGRTVSLPQQRR